ncbi:hypothetical protein GUITHDRAFT_152388 [Guillardia theta CCMP2712]|uniref:NIF system FeS cluster assembly NifU C-terminal domain-containing protein n=1 Tax=Guillardia theta (strain CCMP2712) TaxID=905079 RepID=L1JDA8_GUITC|nr:hypothetical protein GUITHDRAFT_152388 [Guillardia theta CCMP2712]EKX46501.1 hypothetical protein GUITHDRAFT_152388 [Guillardia theta CCMP2712]|eukprot:XP_005833481.1 hypothetical protein GUITHDRAFT_152388 [Guillardia theta CCMP2712]
MAMVTGVTCWTLPPAATGMRLATASSSASRSYAAASPELRTGGLTSLPLQTRKGVALRLSVGGPPMDKEPLDLTEDNVQQALEESKEILGTMFGNSQENREIGITGDVQLVNLDGPFASVRLVGRFWHKRSDVLARVENYVKTRVPEIVEVSIEDPMQLDDNLPENQKM